MSIMKARLVLLTSWLAGLASGIGDFRSASVGPKQALLDLQDAINEPKTDMLAKLLKEKRVTPGNVNEQAPGLEFTYQGYTAMHFACLVANRSAHAKLLLEFKGDPEAKSAKDVRPLHVASANGNSKVVKHLLTFGANPRETSSSGQTGPTMAARKGDINTLKTYRDFGGEAMLVLGETDHSNSSPLRQGIHLGNVELIRFVIFEVGLGDHSRKDMIAAVTERHKSEFVMEFTEVVNMKSKMYRDQRNYYFSEQEKELRGEVTDAMLDAEAAAAAKAKEEADKDKKKEVKPAWQP